jgi:hypothetical protein
MACCGQRSGPLTTLVDPETFGATCAGAAVLVEARSTVGRFRFGDQGWVCGPIADSLIANGMLELLP